MTAELRAAWRAGLVLGVINGALPFTLIAWGEQHIASGVAAIGNSAVPIFNAALAVWLLPSERVNGTRLAGLLLGLAGVGVLAGLNPGGGDSLALDRDAGGDRLVGLVRSRRACTARSAWRASPGLCWPPRRRCSAPSC